MCRRSLGLYHQEEEESRKGGVQYDSAEWKLAFLRHSREFLFFFATQGGKQVSFYFREWNWVQAREAQIRFSAG